MSDYKPILSLNEQLRLRVPNLRVTPVLIGSNILVFLAMLAGGAGWRVVAPRQRSIPALWRAAFGDQHVGAMG